MQLNKIYQGDALENLKKFPSESIDCVVTSPPYWNLRDYNTDGQLGLETTFEEYVKKLCDIFDEVKRVLKKEGTCWVNISDTYSGNKVGKTDNKVSDYLKDTTVKLNKKIGSVPNKSLCCIPDRFKIEMINRGWICRNEIIWYKPNCMPASVKDRFTIDYEKVFLFVKSKKYYFKQQKEPAITKDTSPPRGSKGVLGGNLNKGLRGQDLFDNFNSRHIPNNEGLRNKRSVWTINTKPCKEAHFATYPEALIEPMIDAGCPIGGITLDPFIGSGTTAIVALNQNKKYIGIDLNPDYIKIAEKRINKSQQQIKLF